jgi:hypothetical protein
VTFRDLCFRFNGVLATWSANTLQACPFCGASWLGPRGGKGLANVKHNEGCVWGEWLLAVYEMREES